MSVLILRVEKYNVIRWFQGRRFKPGLIPTIATVAWLVLLIGLGSWQLDRRTEKQQMFDNFDQGTELDIATGTFSEKDAADKRFSRIRVDGQYDPSRQFLLDLMVNNRSQVGYHVLTPLKLAADGSYILVNRGWVPAGLDRSRLPDITVDASPRQVIGRVDFLPRTGIKFDSESGTASTWPRVVLFPTIEELEAKLGSSLFAYVVLLDPAQEHGFERRWRPKLMSPARHLGYAVQWFALATALFLIYVIVNMKPIEDSND